MSGMHPSTERPEAPEVSRSDGAYLPAFGLTSLQVVAAIELSKGRKAIDIKRQFNISDQMWRSWQKNRRFLEYNTSLLQQRESVVIEILKDAELQAAAVLAGALNADSPMRHKDGKIRLYPNWEVRTRAAISVLDRKGERGKPIERVASSNVNHNVPAQGEVAQALNDPAVKAFLAGNPAFEQKLRGELQQLAAGGEPVEASENSSP